MVAPGFVLIGNETSRRVELFQAALAAKQLPLARLVRYSDLIQGRVQLAEVVHEGDILRIESPGKDAAVEHLLLAVGADAHESEAYDRLDREQLAQLHIEKGRIVCPHQWYLGFCAVLDQIEQQRALCPPHTLMNHPADIAAMFDKRTSHQRMQAAGISVPRGLGPIASYEQLLAAMRRERCSRVFVKLAHGSSASGVVAYQISATEQLAISTVDLVRGSGGELRLYNSRKLRHYRDLHDIADLFDALCHQCVHVEQWLPKAGFSNRIFDLRVVVIANQVRHVVVRLSRGPMTNLHLLNERGDRDAVLARMGEHAWQQAEQTCLQTMACFPRSCYSGIDLLIQPGFQRHAVLEINAFGDLLPNIFDRGEDTYAAEINACASLTNHSYSS